MAGLAYREAHTPYAAADAVEYLVDAFGRQGAWNLRNPSPFLMGWRERRRRSHEMDAGGLGKRRYAGEHQSGV